ncbi:hypothetical protein [Mycolicibacterium fortuitum]|uniref:hypothetical protein n=1 Tax=Mycolicibacterium fortuitum TaxID=1766 RepID=UPI00263558B9|nr:hypothetical protein [Mycolicibacterium fortuitum]
MTLDVRQHRPEWRSTGDKEFPFAADVAGSWWVLRLNHVFPERDLYTLFVDSAAIADFTPDRGSDMPLLATAPLLSDIVPQIEADSAASAIGPLSGFVE